MDHRHQIHLSRVIRQSFLNDSARVNLMSVLQQILLDENLKFIRMKRMEKGLLKDVVESRLEKGPRGSLTVDNQQLIIVKFPFKFHNIKYIFLSSTSLNP